MTDVTHLLSAIQQGDSRAAEELLPLVYDELRKLAAARMAKELPNQTLQPTALVHEAWIRLAGNDAATPFVNRAHFFAAAAEAMRRILIERARRKSTEKRGVKWERVDLENVEIASDVDDQTLLEVNESLERLAKEEPKAAELVKLRFFGGLTVEEAARVLKVTDRTARRYWAYARAWLYDELSKAR